LFIPTIKANDWHDVVVICAAQAPHGCLAVQGELPNVGQSDGITALEALVGELPSDLFEKNGYRIARSEILDGIEDLLSEGLIDRRGLSSRTMSGTQVVVVFGYGQAAATTGRRDVRCAQRNEGEDSDAGDPGTKAVSCLDKSEGAPPAQSLNSPSIQILLSPIKILVQFKLPSR